jgi:hypothetical protein
MDLDALQGELEQKVGERMEALHVPGVAVPQPLERRI